METSLIGFVLIGVAIFAARNRWISTPFAVMLAIAWASALQWLPASLPLGPTFPVVAGWALWTELGWITLGKAALPAASDTEAALRGVLIGAGVGALFWGFGFPSWLALVFGFVGGITGVMRSRAEFKTAFVATILLPVRGEAASGPMPIVFLAALALGAVPR